MTVQEIVERSFDYGVIGVALFACVYGGWKWAGWFGNNFILPVKEKLIEFVDKIAANNDTLVELQRQQAGVMMTMKEEVKETADSVAEHAETLHRIDKNVDELCQRSRRFFDEQHRDHEERYKGG